MLIFGWKRNEGGENVRLAPKLNKNEGFWVGGARINVDCVFARRFLNP